MCGIAGFVDTQTEVGARLESVGRMCAAMVHRGPDDDGFSSNGSSTLGMRRLSIFDPANGHQPMFTPDGRYSIVFNGAIYNFHELKAELASGYPFRTQCDTEVLLAAYARLGEKCLDRIRGMYAFAVWDALEQSLFLARDPFGIKPLYLYHQGSRLVFCSELDGLFASGALARRIDPVAVADYLGWFSVPAPRTIFQGVCSLRPGEYARFRGGRLEIASAWDFRTIPPDTRPCASQGEFDSELRARLDDSVRAHLLADVPVGAFLSGGLDSAVIVGLMTAIGGRKLKTFSLGFDEPGYSEASDAGATARHFGADHQGRVITGSEVARDLEKFLGACDHPTGDGLNTYYISQTARAGGVTVALSGLGGDELFGGYPSFRDLPRLGHWLPRWRRLPRALRSSLVRQLRRGGSRPRKLADFLEHAHDLHELGSMHRRVFSEPGRRALLGPDAIAAIGVSSPFHPELANLRAELPEAQAMEVASAWELRTYMADVLLLDSDVMSMRHSLELRVPFVDRPLIEWVWRQPAQYRFTPRHPKDALASASADILPPGLRHRKKRGFTLPMPIWMRNELKPFIDEAFSDSSVRASGLFHRSIAQATWKSFLDRNDDRDWSRVWSLAVLISFVNRRAPPSPSLSSAPFAMTSRPAKQDRPRTNRRRPDLLMVPEIFSSIGGIPRILQLYLKALCELDAQRGAGVKLISLNDPVLDSRDQRRYASTGLEDWRVCSRKKRYFVTEALRMSRGCRRVICGHVAQLPVAWMARRINRRQRYYLIAHGIEVWRPFKLIERVALRGATRVLCVSEFTRREVLRRCPLPDGRAVVLHNALDPYFIIEDGVPLAQAAPVILTVSRLTYADRYKGVEHLIEAMPAVRAGLPDARLRIVGQGEDTPRLQKLAQRSGLLNSGVEFLGTMSDARLAEEMRSCRLFAMPSGKEGFGLVFLEAMAHGRPCLGARAGGIPEVITDDTGILVEFGNVRAIADGCVAALTRTWNSERMLERAREFSYAPFKARLSALLE